MSATTMVQTRDGPMLALQGDQYITPCLKAYGELSPPERAMLMQLIEPGMCVVEVGSNIGAFTVAMARACRPGPLYAFEPQQRVFQILCANLALNDVDNVVASPDACGRALGRAAIPPLDYDGAANFGGVSLAARAGGGQEVRVIALDSLELPACGLIKVDVEGFEAEVLQGAAQTIARCRPRLYVENDRAHLRDALIRLIHGMGYRLYWHTPPLASRENFNGLDRLVLDRNYLSINMLCLPAEQDDQTNLEPIDPDHPDGPAALRRPGG